MDLGRFILTMITPGIHGLSWCHFNDLVMFSPFRFHSIGAIASSLQRTPNGIDTDSPEARMTHALLTHADQMDGILIQKIIVGIHVFI